MENEIEKVGSGFFEDITKLLVVARASAYRTVNSIMVETYWKIGRRIVEEEQMGETRAVYGERLIENLSRYLAGKFGSGFSVANLKNIRKFYLVCPELDRHCLSNLSWSNICAIMRISNSDERNFYFEEAATENWSYRVLVRNIKTGYYHRLLSHGANPHPNGIVQKYQTTNFIKDPYVLEFLDVPNDLSGKETLLENALISNLQKFLLELGKGFSFVARQQRISTETDHFYVDLVFYNYMLKCFVLIDLKTSKLTHSDIGQMDMYVRMFDDLRRGDGDNPTIGIIFCTDKSETMVKYSILKESRQIFASKYMTVLPSEEELSEMIERENSKLFLD